MFFVLKKEVIHLLILYLLAMRQLFFLSFFLISLAAFSQQSFSKEFSLLTDNDLYTSLFRDRYYSNGLFLTYRQVHKAGENKKIKKIISSFQLGHMIFTPVKATLEFAAQHDRPFAGYLFGEYGRSYFYKNQNTLITKLQLGAIGPNSQGKELQNFIHGIYNFPNATGWKHQIKGAIAVNLEINYSKYLSKMSFDRFDLSSYSVVRAGTVFTDISTGVYSRFGFKKLQKLYNSTAFNSNLNTKNGKNYSESYIYIKPLISYIMYDATIQGSFLNTNSPVTYDIMPFKFSLEIGYRYNWNRFNYGYTFHYHTKKLKSIRVKNSNTYGSIYIGYNFN